ncbi:hypothetical protein GTW20_03915 [Nocardiopsis alba]|uniref:Uncharacterized protein n=2 Tax=Nocardiopsis alba TaxID=53437 RepID=A0A7K2IN76_9ACTN|nr:hypothetical protein [Nocardiopsis alba]MYR31431.1 hypothetical protein [Nocardiopsis alba]
MASTMATSDHTPEQVQEWAQSLVTEGMWGEQAEVAAVDPGRIDPAVPEFEFRKRWFEEGELGPARLDRAGRIESSRWWTSSRIGPVRGRSRNRSGL